MLRRRGEALDPPIHGLPAHQFRHTAAHRWMAEGDIELDSYVTGGCIVLLARTPRCAGFAAPHHLLAVCGSAGTRWRCTVDLLTPMISAICATVCSRVP